MKVFLIEWSGPLFQDIAQKLKKHSLEVLYISGDSSQGCGERAKKAFPKAIFHDTFDAIKTELPENITLSDFQKVPSEILARMRKYEDEVVVMMNRTDYTNVSPEKRKQFFYAYIHYWYGFLQQLKPEVIIFDVMPHLVYDYVLYCLAKEFGIKTLMFETARIGDRVLLMQGKEEGSIQLKEEIQNLKHNPSLDELSPDLQEYYNKHTKDEDAEPFYMKNVTSKNINRFLPIPKLRKIVASILDLTILNKIKNYFSNVFSNKSRLTALEGNLTGVLLKWNIWKWDRALQSYKKEYQKLQQKPDYNKKYIYVALPMQPEKNTSPQAGKYVDQFLMLEDVIAALPEGWVIYVKEHLGQWRRFTTHMHQGRYKGYYKKMAELPNVQLVPAETSSFELIKHAQAVVSATGTVALEAALRRVPAIIFGYPWFMYCESVLKVHSRKEYKHAVQRIVKGYKPSLQDSINFLYCLDKASSRGYFEPKWEKVSTVSYEQNIKNLASLLVREFKDLN
jgi:hypothetical protein